MIPKPSIWMIRLSLVYFSISAGLGSMIFIHKAIDIHSMLWAFLPIHYELAMWGWLVQFVMGTAYWIFPKKLEGERRGPAASAWAMVIIFNSGLIFLITSHLFSTSPSFTIIGRVLITVGILIFTILIWFRIVSYRNI